VYDLNSTLSLYASFTDIFLPQTAQDVAGNFLEPRTGDQYEMGIKGEFAGGLLNAHAAVFRLNDKNRAITDLANPDFSIAAGEARSEGFEVEVGGNILPAWDVIAGYAFTETEYERADPEQQGLTVSPGTPKHNFKVWTRYSLAAGESGDWRIGAGANAIDGIYSEDGTSRWEQGGYVLASAQIGFYSSRNIDVTLNGYNLFDKKYYSRVSAGGRQNYYGEPRSYMLTVRANY
jgi:outer-membrane receptor for ferric coprogen and ferric-rhodotorulic acid